ncbi:M48 family metalloprotease [uncultured Pseudonocardia sp.]|uniref:M48 family metalloprotease n=1 Tax=uncultured Pseudonocardia sp. TaxID=211455 RepID=UPI002618BCA6|nr:M48 family metalloprotease [uncultured Pseudonocardia sp.]
MIISVYLPMLVSLLLAAAGPALSRLGPARAGAALVVAAATAAAASTWALVLLAAASLPSIPLVSERVAARGGRFLDPVPDVVAVSAVIALTIGIGRVIAVVHRRGVVTRSLRELCATCGAGGQELVVAAVARPEAFAVPGRWGRPGQILVTRGMLRALDAAQRRALLAHERAHLRCRHHHQRAVVEIAAALNPLLIPARDAVAYLVERVADEHAATAIGDRRVTADALATAALTGYPGPRSPGVLAYSRYGVARRVAALHAPALPERRLPPVLLILLAGLTAAAAGDATLAFARLVHALFPGL